MACDEAIVEVLSSHASPLRLLLPAIPQCLPVIAWELLQAHVGDLLQAEEATRRLSAKMKKYNARPPDWLRCGFGFVPLTLRGIIAQVAQKANGGGTETLIGVG